MDFGRNAWCIAGVPRDGMGARGLPRAPAYRGGLTVCGWPSSRPLVPRATIPRVLGRRITPCIEQTERMLDPQALLGAALRVLQRHPDLTVGHSPRVISGRVVPASCRTARSSSPTSPPRRSLPRQTVCALTASCTPRCRWCITGRPCATSGCASRAVPWRTTAPKRARTSCGVFSRRTRMPCAWARSRSSPRTRPFARAGMRSSTTPCTTRTPAATLRLAWASPSA